MTQRISAIPTSYAGVEFRSATEARFAAWCDKRGLEWFYEPEGFEFAGVRYLPDFYIPSGKWIVEVKPPMFMDECWKIKEMQLVLPSFHYAIGTMDREVFKWAAHSDWNGCGRHNMQPVNWVTPSDFLYDSDQMWFCRECTRPFFPTSGGWECPHCEHYGGNAGFSEGEIPFNGRPLSEFKRTSR